MNCNCLDIVSNKVLEHVAPKFKKSVEDVVLRDKMLTMPTLDVITCSTFLIELEGQKKQEKMKVAHVFCPFCGVKVKKDETDPEEVMP